MANSYFYSNTAVETTLAGSISSSSTSVQVGAVTGFPASTPYVLAFGYGAADEELVKVTSASGTVLTVERAFGGTSAQSHSIGAKVRHVVNAQDLTDFRTHEQDGTAVHGLAGDVVGTTDTQTLSGKTLTAPVINGASFSTADVSGDPVFTGDPSFTGSPTFTAPSNVDAVTFQAATEANAAVLVQATGDATPRLQVAASGALYYGDGTNAADVILYREAAEVLATQGILRILRPTEAEDAISVRLQADTASRYLLEAGGKLSWGDGTAPQDTTLERTGAAALATNGTFSAQTEVSNTFTAASGFTLIGADSRRTCGVCTISVLANVDTEIPTTGFAGNIVDTAFGTLPPGYRPAERYDTNWSNGFTSGSALITEDGVIQLRTSDAGGTIEAGTSLTVSATFVL